MDKNLTLSYYALANYVEENRETALNSSFKGKNLRECLGIESPYAPANDASVQSFVLDQCDNPVLVSMQLELLVQKDPAEFVGKLQAGFCGEKDAEVREQKLECLLLLAGQLPAPEEGVSKLEQLELCYNKLGDGKLSEKILEKLGTPEPPAAALALYLGAGKPWVRRRLEMSNDATIWQELVTPNFNTSPKVLMEGLSRLTASNPGVPVLRASVAQKLAGTVWSRPDCQLYLSERRDKLQQVSPESKIDALPELAPLAGLASITSGKKTRAESVAELYALLDEQLKARQPSQDLLGYYAAAGCSPAQAKLRATYCQYAGLENAGPSNPVAARRLAASLQAPRQIDRTVGAPSSFGGWARHIREFAQKCRAAFTVPSPSGAVVQPEHLGHFPPQEGYQSWGHKDDLVMQIEQQLEKDYEIKKTTRPDEDPWKFLKPKAVNLAPEPEGEGPGI